MEPDEIIKLVLAVVGAISAIATAIPNASENKWVQMALNVINAAAMNFGKSKNG